MADGTFKTVFLSPIRVFGLVCLLLLTVPVLAREEVAPALAVIEEARIAIDRGDEQTFRRLKQQLEAGSGHALSPYLDYWALMARLGEVDRAEVAEFLERQPLPHLRRYLRGSWLHRLGREARWSEFRQFDDGRDTPVLRCYAGRAALADQSIALSDKLSEARAFWLVPRSQPGACDPIFEWLAARGELTEPLIRARQQLALDRGQFSLARYLQRQLPEESHDYRDWMRVLADPEAIQSPHFDADNRLHRELSVRAVKHALSDSVERAESLWATQRQRYAFSSEEKHGVERAIALRAAYRHRDDAVSRVASLDPDGLDASDHAWRVRAALRQGDWSSVETFIAAMPETQQRSTHWLYWRARAAEQRGEDDMARRAYRLIADERSYHGFLAAERLNARYRFDRTAPLVDETALSALAEEGAVKRARLLRALGESHLARVEWQSALAGAETLRLERAAALAARWEWHEMAIRAAARAGAMDAIDWRFARPWETELASYSGEAGVDRHWARAVMRRESAYNPEARSSANARGLMQLLPSTARNVARREGLGYSPDLYRPEDNIRLGTAYLGYLKGRMMGSEVLATAAYNAGPERVEEWLPGEAMDADVWIETVPYRETRRYLQAVSEYRAIFHWLEAGAPAPGQRSSGEYRLGLVGQRVGGETLLARSGPPRSVPQ